MRRNTPLLTLLTGAVTTAGVVWDGDAADGVAVADAGDGCAAALEAGGGVAAAL